MSDWHWFLRQTQREQAEAAFRLGVVEMVDALIFSGHPEGWAVAWAGNFFDVRKGTIRAWKSRVRGVDQLESRLAVLCPQRGRTGVPNRYRHLRRERLSVRQMLTRKAIGRSMNRLRAQYPEDLRQ